MSDLWILHDGPTLPPEAVELVIALEARGIGLFRRGVDGLRASQADGKPVLTAAETAGITRWKPHMLALVDYCEKRRELPL